MSHSPAPGQGSPLHIPASSYLALPWKTGQGITEEICLLPEGATRDRFDLRISCAPIPEVATFSAFPGVERVITLIEGAGLDLDFGDRLLRLELLAPCRFDSGLAPVGRPDGDGVRVINVMAARDRWRITTARVMSAAFQSDVPAGGLAVLFAIAGEWEAAGCRIGSRDTLILPAGAATACHPVTKEGNAAALEVVLVPRD
ncbi:HutD family protein [Szabonella alba]|uniref:HutD family protein n=1 Tax=Szabonella alba TaxID=2804194 RepID=A0A8K0VBS6_9RHOB|nr:HutD family protein [Szabonella alba]MBL4919013.1 HutD family protein [Szabonella alba]